MNDVIWNKFIDENIVSHTVLINIAIKIMESIELSEREMAIYAEKSDTIEKIIKIL